MDTVQDSAYPQQITLPNGNTVIVPGLTKLELISAMCLQGILLNKSEPNYANEHCDNAIKHAKELLKQLEASCGQE